MNPIPTICNQAEPDIPSVSIVVQLNGWIAMLNHLMTACLPLARRAERMKSLRFLTIIPPPCSSQKDTSSSNIAGRRPCSTSAKNTVSIDTSLFSVKRRALNSTRHLPFVGTLMQHDLRRQSKNSKEPAADRFPPHGQSVPKTGSSNLRVRHQVKRSQPSVLARGTLVLHNESMVSDPFASIYRC